MKMNFNTLIVFLFSYAHLGLHVLPLPNVKYFTVVHVVLFGVSIWSSVARWSNEAKQEKQRCSFVAQQVSKPSTWSWST